MDKIVLICQKRDDKMNDLEKCLKYLFPECTMELRSCDPKSLPRENMPDYHKSYSE